jgi:hypothetical protein
MIARIVATCLAVSLTACGGYQSQYVRQSAPAGELVWRYDSHLQVTRNGRVVAEGGDWAGLPEVVSCVPRARDWASTATSRHRTGTLLLWAGLIGMLGGLAVGSVVALSDTSSTDNLLGGVAIIGGGLVFGLATAPTGAYFRGTADARGIDAVNFYNDQVGSGAACRP